MWSAMAYACTPLRRIAAVTDGERSPDVVPCQTRQLWIVICWSVLVRSWPIWPFRKDLANCRTATSGLQRAGACGCRLGTPDSVASCGVTSRTAAATAVSPLCLLRPGDGRA